MKIAVKIFSMGGVAGLSLLLLASCGDLTSSMPGTDILTQEIGETDGEDGGDDGGEAVVETAVDCEGAPRCGMAVNNPDLPCAAINGGTCLDGCCEPGVCRGPNRDFFAAHGRDCPQGEDLEGCCIHGRSQEASGRTCTDGPKCSEGHSSGFDLPCVAINGGECIEGCCVAGPCQGPTCAFLDAMGDECAGTCDQEGCCVPGDGEN